MTILKVENLYKVYGVGDTSVTAISDVSFSVDKGEFVAIVGPSGSGKSTLMHLIGGVIRPDSGRVMIEGQDIFALKEGELALLRRRNIGIVYQFYNLISTLTTEENIFLPQLLDDCAIDAERADTILSMVGLSDQRERLPGELSGGQQQRVSIGRALVNSPALILADEPTGSLDSVAGCEIIDLFKQANKNYRQTVIMVTHEEKIALQADRIITLKDGCLVGDERINQ